MNNYRIDIIRVLSDKSEVVYSIEFPEYYLAKMFAGVVVLEDDVKSVYLLERMSDGEFDATRKLK